MVSHERSLGLVLLLTLHLAAGSQRHECQAEENKCDFVCDCYGCSEEDNCGYRKTDFVCDFEDPGLCGWKAQSVDTYTWERRQRGPSLPDSGPSSDHTIGTASGWFMGVTSVMKDAPSTTVLISPEMRDSSPTCRMRIRYFLWDTGHTGLGSTPLWASVLRHDTNDAVVWRPEVSSVRGWREAWVYLGRISVPFRVRLHSQRAQGSRGDVAIDDLEFWECALPLPVTGNGCVPNMLQCAGGGCVEQRQVCDGTDDCGDGTDEANCEIEGYWGCDFEKDLCEWDLTTISTLPWVRTSQRSIASDDILTGPGRDHSTNSVAGHFLYVTVPDGGMTMDWASFQSPLLEPTNSTHPCKMVMYTHQFGPRSGGLTVLVADSVIYPVWERGGAVGDVWVKSEVEIVTNHTFHIVFMAAIRDTAYGGIGIDSIMMSPECRISSENFTYAAFPKPPPPPCTEHAYEICNFNAHCVGAEDEAKCGDFSYAQGSSGWTDVSLGGQGWVLNDMYNTTAEEEKHLLVTRAPGQLETDARTQTPPLGPSGPACTLSFSFALTGTPAHIGDLSVIVIDSFLGHQPKLWEFSGKTGIKEEEWRQAEVYIGARPNRFQLQFEARARILSPDSKIKVKDVRFINCYAGYYPMAPTGMSCNFEDGLCAWYQDKSDNFDWTLLSGMDHSIGFGQSLVVDVWHSSLRGVSGRLLSYPQRQITGEHCLSFYYKLYGPDTGVLNVKVRNRLGDEDLLWTRSGSHGNTWHEAHCPVPDQPIDFQLVFETIRSGFDGRVAIDDVAFVKRQCTVPRMCSFEGQLCGFTGAGATRFLHQSGQTSNTGPRTDHTLETRLGYYMMLNTDADVLPVGSTTYLTSAKRVGAVKTTCVQFWYHSGISKNPGTLTVYMKSENGERVKVFSDRLSQGEVWRHGHGNISSTLSDWQLEFEVVGAGGKNTHIAIDDVVFSAHPCQNLGTTCNLERGLCGWSNTQNPDMDQLDWYLTSEEAETYYSTPPHDHTLGTKKGHFLLLPSSSRTPGNHNAQLLSPHLPPTKGTCLTFWANRPSTADNQLKVWTLSGGLLREQLEINKVEAVWKRFKVNIISPEEYQIVLEGIKATAGVFALDDIDYTVGVDCDGIITDPQTTKPLGDNVGGIVASTFVVVLLFGTLGGVLYYYLKGRQLEKTEAGGQPSVGQPSFTNETYEAEHTARELEKTKAGGQPSVGQPSFTNETYEAEHTDDRVREMEV